MTRPSTTHHLPELQLDCFEAERLADWHEAEARTVQEVEPAQVDEHVCALHAHHVKRAVEFRAYAIRWRQKEGVPSMASEGEAGHAR